MMHKNIFTLLLCLLAFGVFAQNRALKATTLEGFSNSSLEKHFDGYTVVELDANAILSQFATATEASVLRLETNGTPLFEVEMKPNPICAPNYVTILEGSNGRRVDNTPPEVYTFINTEQAGAKAAFTFAKNFVFGFYEQGDQILFVEPLANFAPRQPSNLYVIYSRDQVRAHAGMECGAIAMERERQQMGVESRTDGKDPKCGPRELQVAIANDLTMTQFYSDNAVLVAYNLGLINAVAANWDTEFGDPLFFKVTAQYITLSEASDPWSPSSDRDVLMAAFRKWANDGGFGDAVEYDHGHWRSRRAIYNTLSGAQIRGATYQGAYCSSSRYSIFSEAVGEYCNFKTTLSHEIGHLFGATHTSSTPVNIMMSGTVCNNNWLPVSIAEINTGLAAASCVTNGAASSCPLPTTLPHPQVFWTLMAGQEVCHTFVDPCIKTFSVYEMESNLEVTVSGRTICMRSFGPFDITQVLVVPMDYCMGDPDWRNAFVWYVSSNVPRTSPASSRDNDIAPAALSIVATPDFLLLQDAATEPRLKHLQVFDTAGREVLRQQSADPNTQVPTDWLPAGIWIARVRTGEQIVTKRFVKL